MISICLILTSFICILICLVAALCHPITNKTIRKVIYIAIPTLCLIVIGFAIFRTNFRRKATTRELNELIHIVEYSIDSNKAFESNEQKNDCLDSLDVYLKRLNSIAYEDTLNSLISGKDEKILQNIAQTRNILEQQIKRIKRINDYADEEVSYNNRILDTATISIIEPITDKLLTTNIAYKYSGAATNIRYAYIEVLYNDSITYKKTYLFNKKLNCFVVPNDTNRKEIINIGYIADDNNNFIFIHKTWKENKF